MREILHFGRFWPDSGPLETPPSSRMFTQQTARLGPTFLVLVPGLVPRSAEGTLGLRVVLPDASYAVLGTPVADPKPRSFRILSRQYHRTPARAVRPDDSPCHRPRHRVPDPPPRKWTRGDSNPPGVRIPSTSAVLAFPGGATSGARVGGRASWNGSAPGPTKNSSAIVPGRFRAAPRAYFPLGTSFRSSRSSPSRSWTTNSQRSSSSTRKYS
jgi:hypothetical protein